MHVQTDDAESAGSERSAASSEDQDSERPMMAAPTSDRLLEQSEIDALLGLGFDDSPNSQPSILALINPGIVTYERLPMLEVVFDRLERMLTSTIRGLTAQSVDVTISAVSAHRFGDYLNAIELPAMIAVSRAVEWDNLVLVLLDGTIIYSIVDVLLGGGQRGAALKVEKRAYTTIETALVERLVKLILADLGAAFSPITQVQFKLERLEINPRFAAIARPGNASVVFRMNVNFETRGGVIEFLVPYASLEPVREVLLQKFLGEKFGRDPIWEGHLASEIAEADVQLDAILEEIELPLRSVLDFEVGTLLQLDVTPDSSLELRCANSPMFKGRMGRRGDRLAIAVDERITPEGSPEP